MATPPEQSPFVKEFNKDKSTTIVLLHGLFSSSIEYSDVVKHLSSYHLLVPDLPGHSQSAHIPITSMADIVNKLSSLITTQAKGKKAHIVGLSFGAYIGHTLAASHPDQVSSCFLTGSSTDLSGYLGTWAPYLAYGMLRPLHSMGLFAWFSKAAGGLTIAPEFVTDMSNNTTWSTASSGYGIIKKEYKVVPIKPRTLLVAGAKADPLKELEQMEKVVREGNSESRAVAVKGMYHGWDVQAPELFARCVLAWIERKELPQEMVSVGEYLKV